MRRLILLAVVVTSLALTGCAQPQFWVKGLTLPPGSKVISKTESKTEVDTKDMAPVPVRMMTVVFTCDSDWQSVQSHFEQILRPQGFSTTESDKFGQKLTGDLRALADSMRSYAKNKSPFTVTVTNLEASRKAVSKIDGVAEPSGDPGDFMLTINEVAASTPKMEE